MKRILFVDDEPKVLEGVRRLLHAYRRDWDMVFVTSGQEALQKMAESQFDVLVTDVRMSQMSGIQLLTEVRDRYPQIVRMVLSGQADQDLTLSSVALAHQYLAKPCDAQTLRTTVDRAVSLHGVLEDPALKQVISRIHSLPSVPSIYEQLLKALQSPDVTPKQIGQIIAQDLAMTAKVLQLVNSSFFGLQRHISNPSDAVVYLGTQTVRSLALTVSVFSQFDVTRVPSFSIERLRDRGILVGSLAREIAKSLSLPKSGVDDAFLGGVLHEIGKLILASNYPEEYEAAMTRAQTTGTQIQEAERAIFGTTHARVGAYLLWLWGLPPAITEIVAHYDEPEADTPPSSLLAVHVANALVTETPEQQIDVGLLATTGLVEHLPEWRQMSAEIKQEARA